MKKQLIAPEICILHILSKHSLIDKNIEQSPLWDDNYHMGIIRGPHMQLQPQQIPANAGPAALRTFFNIIERWHLSPDEGQILLATPSSTYFRWKKHPEQAQPGFDTFERISYILGIYKALHLIYSDDSVADDWLNRPNTNFLFGGQAPLKRLLAGHVADLYVTRQHLDARRGVI